MLVMKFGGTSVGSAARFAVCAEIIDKTRKASPAPVVVLSAMAGITNQLIEGAESARERNLEAALKCLEGIRQRHIETVNELFQDEDVREDLYKTINDQLADLEILYRGVSYLGELTRRSLDMISSFGELLSTRIMARYLNDRGIKTSWLDARDFLITDGSFGNASPLMETTRSKTSGAVLPEVAAGRVVVTQGFIGATSDGITTTLGRGGSDYSASIIGVACDAREIQIWTDVDGMLTADPRVVPEARIIERVSFHEASELAYFGAKVLHPLSIKPAIESSIPVRILNSLKPEGEGTVITADATSDAPICAIASKKGITALFITSLKMLMTHGYLARVFSVFDRFKTPIDLISTSEVSVSLTIDNTENLESIVEALSELAEVSVMHKVAIVSVVGRQFREKTGIAGTVFDTLKDINILMISGGASDINLSCLVAGDDADRAVRQLHARFFTSTGKLTGASV